MLQLIKVLIAKLLIGLVRIYQYTISPMLGSNCRHSPTCSAYMIQAIQEWGPIKGTFMGLKRIGRCHPWGTHGHDPVPRRNTSIPSEKQRQLP